MARLAGYGRRVPSVVVIPATPLLVPGAAGAADPLAAVREVVREVLRGELPRSGSGGGARAVVLGTGPAPRAGRLRPSLAAAGIADSVLGLADDDDEDVADAGGDGGDGVAATGPSVALLALVGAGIDLAAEPVEVVEVPGDAPAGEVAAVAGRLRAPSAPGLLVVADHPAPGVDAVLEALTADGGWEREEHELPQDHGHLPPSYRITVLRRG